MLNYSPSHENLVGQIYSVLPAVILGLDVQLGAAPPHQIPRPIEPPQAGRLQERGVAVWHANVGVRTA